MRHFFLFFSIFIFISSSFCAEKDSLIKFEESIDEILINLTEKQKLDTLQSINEEQRKRSESIESILILKKILGIVNESSNLNYNLIKAESNFYLGTNYLEMGSYSKSIKYSNKALLLSKNTKDKSLFIKVLQQISWCYTKLKINKIAKEYLDEAYTVTKINNQDLSPILFQYSVYFQDLNELDSALFYQNKYEALTHKKGKDIHYNAYNNKGNIFRSKSNLDSAIFYFKKGLYQSGEIANRSKSSFFHNLALSYYEKVELDSATRYNENNIIFAKEHNFNRSLLFSYRLKALLFSERKMEDSSIFYQDKAMTFGDSLFTSDLKIAVDNIELLYDIESEKLVSKKLVAENKVKSFKFNLVLIILFFLIVIILFIIYNRAKINKAYKIIVKESVHYSKLHEESILLRKELIEAKEKERLGLKVKKPINSNLDTNLVELLEFEIRKAFDKDKVYLDKELTIIKLANNIGSNRNYVSQVFNNRIQTSFPDMLNLYRVNEAKKLLLDEEKSKYSFDAIAEMSGFNSKTTFYRSFKKITNVTPSFFIKEVRAMNK